MFNKPHADVALFTSFCCRKHYVTFKLNKLYYSIL